MMYLQNAANETVRMYLQSAENETVHHSRDYGE
jgi:hypothetical protein